MHYGQDVVEEIDRLTNINSPQNIQKYIAMKDVVKNEMLQFNLLHGKVVSSKLLKFLGQSDLSQLRQFRENATALLQFVKNNFDDNLENKQKVYMDAFCKKINAYLRCIDRDEMIISKHINRKYGFFERRSDIKESQRIFDSYLYL